MRIKLDQEAVEGPDPAQQLVLLEETEDYMVAVAVVQGQLRVAGPKASS
jgi:hypothetical protein